MRRFVLAFVMVMVGLAVFAGGKDEGTITVTVLATKGPAEGVIEPLWVEAMKPTEAAVRWMAVNLSDGSTISMDMLVASGAYPNVYADFTGRVSRYMVRTKGWKALDLKPYVDESQYYDLGPWTRDGMLLGLPTVVPLQGMGLNLTLLKEAGYVVPKDWTTDDFIDMCKAVAKLPGKYGTALFAKSASADYLWMNWFGSFGAQVFKAGDYSKTALNSPEGVATVSFLGGLVQNGYAPKDSADLWDDAALELWQKGLVAAMPIRPDWITGYMKAALDQKQIPKAFEYTMVPFPRGPGVTAVPTLGAGSTGVAYDSGNLAVDKASAKFVAMFMGKEHQTEILKVGSVGWGAWPTRKDVPPQPNITGKDLEMWLTVDNLKRTAGVMDVGYTLPQYAAIRAELFPRMAALYLGKETPEEVLAKFETTVNGILAQ